MENALIRLDDSYEGAMNADNRTIKGMAEDIDILSGKLDDFYGALLGR